MEEASDIHTQIDALTYMTNYLNSTNYYSHETDITTKINYIKKTVIKDIAPHVGCKFISKCNFVGLMVNKLLKYHIGIYEVGNVKKDEVVLVSGAAGGVGSLVCQLAKIKGAKVIGVAGGSEKCKVLINEIGVDAAIDYKKDNLDEKLKFYANDGIDIFFDNVGGEILDVALDNIRERARVVICGAISQYSHHDSVDGPSLYLRLAEKYSKMEGFTVMHFEDRYAEASKELLDLYKKGKLKIPYHIEDGIENFPLALQKLFTGGNTGKLMVKI